MQTPHDFAQGSGPAVPERRTADIALDPGQFRKMGHDLVDRIAGLLVEIHDRPVTPGETAERVREALDAGRPLPGTGEDPATLLSRAADLLLNHSLFNGHPRFMGYVTSSPAPLGMLGDLLASAVNANTGAWALSPMASEMERQTVQWIGEFIGYPAGGGLMVSGGNLANFVGFLAALRSRCGQAPRRSGLRNLDRQLTAYCGEGTHTWIQKAADLFGLGTDHIRWIGTDSLLRMDTEQLEAAIGADLRAGFEPFLVAGTAGTVSTGAVDPLEKIAAICRRYGLWFHVDGAYGGFAAALPESDPGLAGIALADSVAVDHHKWLYAPLEAGCVLVRDMAHLSDAFAYHPPYYNFEESVINYVDYGLQNSRGFRALKVWLTLQQLGSDGYRRLIREDILLARYAYRLFEDHPEFEALTWSLSISTFRFVPADLSGKTEGVESAAYLNDLNRALLNRVQQEGRFYVSNAVLGGRYALRLCIVNFRTSAADLEALPPYLGTLGRELDAALRPDSLRAGQR